MMMGMNGGAVWARPEVSRTANAYSFHAKIRQKIAVATMPVVACGKTTLRNAFRSERRRGLGASRGEQDRERIFVPREDQTEDRGRDDARGCLWQDHPAERLPI